MVGLFPPCCTSIVRTKNLLYSTLSRYASTKPVKSLFYQLGEFLIFNLALRPPGIVRFLAQIE